MPAKTRLLSLAVAAATFATISCELLLTRIFSVTLYYHFAFLVISLALLGLTFAGVVVSLAPRVFSRERAAWQSAVAMLATAVGMVIALRVALSHPIELEIWSSELRSLFAIYFASALPFVFSGFAVTLAIAHAGPAIGRIYAYDLIGAAAGCVFLVPAVSSLTAPGAILATAGIAAASSVLFALTDRALPRRRTGLAAIGAVAAVALLALAWTEGGAHRFGLARNPSKFLGERPVLFEQWNAFSHITVAPAGAPDHRWIFIDADAATRVWSGEIAAGGYEAPRRIPEVRLASAGYALRRRGPALIIGPGGGTDVISALRHGVPRVVGVEINPIIVRDVMRGRFAGFSGDLYRDPRVEVVVDEGRSFIRRSSERYSTIQATLVDTWASSSSGAFTLSENNIYTVEAFTEFFDHLQPDGLVMVTRWYDPGAPKEFLRLVALAREALEQRGVAPADSARHIALLADTEGRATLLAGIARFGAADMTELERVARDGELSFLFRPDRSAPGEDRTLAGYLRSPSGADFLARLPYDATPTRDDRPFFFYTLWPSKVASALSGPGSEGHNIGVAILLVLLALSSAVTFVLVLLPMLLMRRSALQSGARGKLRMCAYFVGLGLGFILIEIGLMQRFVLFLGHPIYALIVVLAVLLGAAGIGSALSRRGADRWGPVGLVRRAGGALIAIALIYGLALTPLFHALLGAPLPLRIAVAALLVFLPGVVMGMLLPSGMRVIAERAPEITAWAWALNGAASVLGTIAAMFLSMNFGFSAALGVGIAVYALAIAMLPASAPTAPIAVGD